MFHIILKPRSRGGFWLDGLRALLGGVPEKRSDVTSYGVGLHDCSRNRARNWVHSRILPSRDYFLSAGSTRKTAAIVPLLSLVCGTGPAATPRLNSTRHFLLTGPIAGAGLPGRAVAFSAGGDGGRKSHPISPW